MQFFTLIVIGISLAAAVVQNAGEANWNWTLCPVAAAIGLYYLVTPRESTHRLDRYTAALALALIAGATLQVIPLPVSLVKTLSPHRVELLQATEPVLGPIPSTTTISLVPRITQQWVLTLGVYLLVFVFMRELTRKLRDQRRIWFGIWPLLLIGAFEGALGFYQAYAVDGGPGMATGTYGNRDHYAGLLELILPFAVMYPVAILQRDRNRHDSPAGPALKACGVLVFATVILIGIIHSLSRMGFLATLASLFVAGSVALTLRTSTISPPLKIQLWRRYLPTALVGVVVLLGFIFLPTDPLIARFADLAKTDDISADTRSQIWRDTVGMVKDFPLVGVGLGGYESSFLRYKVVAPMNTVDFAHNDYLQVLAEMGVAGFAIGILLLYRVMRSAIRGIIYAGSPDERCLSIACLASLTAILLHSFVDFNMYRWANAMTVAWICGITSYRISANARKRTTASSLAPMEAASKPVLQ